MIPEKIQTNRPIKDIVPKANRTWHKHLYGVFYGWTVGLAFAVTTWGFDAFLLSQAHVELAWFKFIAGLLFTLIVGGTIGWLIEKLDSSLVAALLWPAVGILFSWFATRVMFTGMTWITSLIHPELRGLDLYPFSDNVSLRMIIAYVVIIITFGAAGALQTYLVESARSAASGLMQVLTLAVVVPLIALGGNAVDNINQPFRNAFLDVNAGIEFARHAQTVEVDKQLEREMHLRSLEPLGELINQPYRLSLGHYDLQDMDNFRIIINFGEQRASLDGSQFAYCDVYVGGISNCQLSETFYRNGLACQARGNEIDKCTLQPAPDDEGWFQTWLAQAKNAFDVKVLDMRGFYSKIALQGGDGQTYECGVHVDVRHLLDDCRPVEADGYGLIPATPKPLPTREPTQTPTPRPTMEGSAEATAEPVLTGAQPLLPAASATLPDLSAATHYSITLNVAYDASTFSGVQAVDYTNTEDVALDRVYFRLIPNGKGSFGNGSLAVTKMTVAGKAVDLQPGGDRSVLEAPLASPLSPGQKVQFTMAFEGRVPQDFGGSETPAGYGIYNLSDGVMALSGWYPILAVYDEDGWNLDPVSDIGDSIYSDISLYSVNLTTDSKLKVAATGVTLERQVDGTAAQEHIESGPARDFFLTLSPDFEVVSQTIDGTQVNSYYLPGHQDSGETALNVASRSLEAYNELIGPYPYTELDVVEAPMRNASGVEFPGIVLIGAFQYVNPQSSSFAVTVAHEVAHQWWYNVVGNDVFDDPWLDEALTTYTSLFYLEHTFGPASANGLRDYWQGRYDDLIRDQKDAPVAGSLAFFEGLNQPGIYSRAVYNKGALFFQALRDQIGDDAFFAALRDYYHGLAYRIARPEDLLSRFEEASGQQLDEIYNQWLYEP